MEENYSKRELKLEPLKSFKIGGGTARCSDKRFSISNKGNNNVGCMIIPNEGLESITFDIEKKTVTMMMSNPILTDDTTAIVDLSENPEFFDGLRENIENILTEGRAGFTIVTPNEDRTVFTISE